MKSRRGGVGVLVLAGVLLLLSAGAARAQEQEFLWESFETETTWASESARGAVKVEKVVDPGATEDKTVLKLSYEPANRDDFEVRREGRLDLSKMRRIVLDVRTDTYGIQAALAFRATPGGLYFETPAVTLLPGLNRNVTFLLDPHHFNRFKNPVGEPFQGRDDVRRVSLVFWRDRKKTGKILVDNIRMAGSPEDAWETFAPRITGIRQNDFIVRAWEIIELKVDFLASFGDFFDPEDIALWASVRDPDGKTFDVPGFLARFDGPENAKQKKPVWLIRIAPRSPGKYEYTVTVRNRMGEKVSELRNFTAVANDAGGGFVGVAAGSPATFVLDSGAPFYPVGHNVCWANDYEAYFAKLKGAGENFTRIWICPWNLCMEKKTKLGEYDLDAAARLDAVLASAKSHGIRVMLVLQYHGMLNSASWDDNPYNARNGGPCTFPSDYFSDRRAKQFTKRFYRYAAARWGAYSSLMCWELFNEVDLTDYYDPDDVIAWHREMGAFMKKTDGHGHLVTSSAIREGFCEKLWKLAEMDFNTGHVYNALLPEAILRKSIEAEAYGKPFFVAECAGGIQPEDDQRDPKGVRLHGALWSSFMSPAAGAAMPWWWDTHIEPNDLYGHFAGLSAFAEGEDRRGRSFRSIRAMIETSGNRNLAVQGILDHAGGYLWVYDPVWLSKPEMPTERQFDAGTVLNLTGLLDGPYEVETWGTLAGRRRTMTKLAADDGKLSMLLPAFSRDVAIKVRFLGARAPSVQSTAGWSPATPAGGGMTNDK
ncbi:MAG TPA: cellulase family glycosylhydrolase [Planctomycetota bacterium]|nr:cellulase family glycosylhydrolase [Planctomycetota bacterium]